jgi:hypothetical protein
MALPKVMPLKEANEIFKNEPQYDFVLAISSVFI